MNLNRLLFVAAALVSGTLALAQEPPASVMEAVAKANASIERIVAIPDDQRTFENTVLALDDLGAQLDDDTSLTIFMQYVSTKADERDASRAADEYVTNWYTELGKREDLYKAIKAYADTKSPLDGEQKRLLDFTMRDYRRAGMDLPTKKRDELKTIELEMNKLSIDFQQNADEDPATCPLTFDELKGAPKEFVAKLPRTGAVYLVDLDDPSIDTLMSSLKSSTARNKVWITYKRKGGEKNVRILERLLRLRFQEASLLGFKSYEDYVLEPRMAKDAATVAAFYAKLRPIVRRKALLDWAEINAAKAADTHQKHVTVYPWDVYYYRHVLLKTKYDFDRNKVREYFPVDAVIKGLFGVAQHLYGIEFKDVTADHEALGLPLWTPDVRLFQVTDKASGKVIGHFYFDSYVRPNKYTGAACWSLQARKVWPDGHLQLPLAALVTNFEKGTSAHPALLPHDDVVTFFHEFGHCLHDLLTETTISRFSGTNVELDFVEAPSQMFENWAWDPGVLSSFARNYKTGKPLPADLLKHMKDVHLLCSGLDTEGQFFYGIVDQKYHTAPEGKVDTTLVGINTVGEVELFHGYPNTMYQASFTHLLGYGGGYYSYEWSLVYAQDMFQRFRKYGLLNPQAGMYYRKKVLAHGGSVDAVDMLHDYLGRAPSMEGYLQLLGLEPQKKTGEKP